MHFGETPGTRSAGAFAVETFASLAGGPEAADAACAHPAPFVQPGWMRAWQETFAPRASLWIRSFRLDGKRVGIAALRQEGSSARLVGDADVCDHLDLVCAAGDRRAFCSALLDCLKANGIERLELNPLRPDSVVMTALVPAARARGCSVSIAEENVLFEMRLPDSWEGYLQTLSGKQRHEARRKLRRLEQSATAGFRLVQEPAAVRRAVNDFLVLFRQNRQDKAVFMDERMESYFRRLAEHVPGTCLGFLDVDGMPAAAVWCCDHAGTRYLYNSGYDAQLSHLSVGILCKLLSIRDAIARGLGRYDFLKGDEVYKRQLGGRPVPIYNCRIDLGGTSVEQMPVLDIES
jgi:CelD/BcsL family acetyltransferase involved in cellulose biosynthesis